MLVRNNQPHIFRVGVAEGEDEKQTSRDITFMPGVNEVRDEDWDLASDHPLVKARVESGSLEELSGKKAKQQGVAGAAPGVGTPGPHNADPTLGLDNAGTTRLSDLDEKEAVKVIKQTVHAETLSRWAGQQGLDSKLQHAIQQQLEAVKAGKADGGGGKK